MDATCGDTALIRIRSEDPDGRLMMFLRMAVGDCLRIEEDVVNVISLEAYTAYC